VYSTKGIKRSSAQFLAIEKDAKARTSKQLKMSLNERQREHNTSSESSDSDDSSNDI